jgi:hypothetical protein
MFALCLFLNRIHGYLVEIQKDAMLKLSNFFYGKLYNM